MATVYILTFKAQWRERGRISIGKMSYPVSAPNGWLDMTDAILACQVLATMVGTLLFPDEGVQITTVVCEMLPVLPLWDDIGVRVY